MLGHKINNRELSWLAFNERVLRQALDLTNPLLERLKFLAIFSSNLDEYFMVRVSGIYEQIEVGYEKQDLSGYKPKELLKAIFNRAKTLSDLQQQIFIDLKTELKKEGIHFPKTGETVVQREVLESIFLDEIMPVISPVTIDMSHPFPFIYGRRMCIITELTRKQKNFISLITIPETLKRIYKIRKGRSIYVYTVEDIIRLFLPLMYKGYKVEASGFFRITRDADLDVTEEESADLLKSVEYSLSKRKHGNINRVEVSQDMPASALHFLKKMLDFSDEETEIINGTIDLTFLYSLSTIKESLMYPPLVQRPLTRNTNPSTLFNEIRKKPLFFFRPYNPFSVVSDLVAQAATDKGVLAIKMTLYRTNSDSGIIASLLEAAKNGKQVSVVVELKARFDEERNIEWAKNLEQAGCLVTYGIVGLKIHAKCMLIVRKENNKIVRYTHVATGNYNENTAKVYTDIDIITSDEDMGRDATRLFNYLTGFTEEENWSRMCIAPFALRSRILEMIDKEIELTKSGKAGRIIMKMNSFIDEEITEKIYEASMAGVKVDLIVRGICGIKPQVPGLSDNIRVISIVGRFLEHSRVLYFYHGGEENLYITSADLMPRNLNGRVELMVNAIDPDFKKALKSYLEVSLRDNCKSWLLKNDTYSKIVPKGRKIINSQEIFLESDNWNI